MSFKRWLALLLFYISYLFFGASIYYFIEHGEEVTKRAIALDERIKISAYISENLKGDDDKKIEILSTITEYCGKKVTVLDENELEDPFRWTFYHAFFFSFTVCSTVGYGNLSPSTTLGRMILIAYSLIGMPVNTILFAVLGDFFGRLFRNIYRRYKNYKMSNNNLYIPRQFGLVATIGMALIPGIFFCIILPSCIFSYFEGWPFSLSIYYSYVTTTTIGFGDYVPTFQPHQERYFGGLFVVYQIFIIIWFIFALGYLLMIMGFITNGLRSKHLRNLERQLKTNIKTTQHRIWHGVLKDVGYLRKVINEVYINVKPVYNEQGPRAPCDLYKSTSCPDLSMYNVTTPILSRKRALSESYNKFMKDGLIIVGQGTPVNRASSDTDLAKINKEKTFEIVNPIRETTNLLAKVVSALSNIQPPQYELGPPETSSMNSASFGAYNCFSDSQILADEKLPPTNVNELYPPPHRERACSDFFINPKTIPMEQNEWTWSGDNSKIQKEINDRVRLYKNNNLTKTALYKSALNNSVVLNVDPKDEIIPSQKKKRSRKFSSDFFMDIFRRRSSAAIIDGVNQKNYRKKSIDIQNFGGNMPSLEERVENMRNNFETASSHNSSLKSEKKSGFLSFNNNNSNETIHTSLQEYNSRSDVNQMKLFNHQRKGSLYPFHSNNIMNEFRDPSNLHHKALPQRHSIFYKPNRSGSLAFPMENNRFRTSSLNNDYDKSIDSMHSNNNNKKDEDILENTSIADLIRALEVLHTRAVTETDQFTTSTIEEESSSSSPEENTKKKRRIGTIAPPKFSSPLFSIFSGNDINIDNQQIRQDRFDEIRSIPTTTTTTTTTNIKNNTSNNSRRSSLFSESNTFNKRDQQLSDINKYGRRFSVRPANELQIPTGKSQFSMVNHNIGSGGGGGGGSALQRKLSLRLSKDFNRSGSSLQLTGTGSGTTGSGTNLSDTNRNSTRKPFRPTYASTNKNFNSNTNSEC